MPADMHGDLLVPALAGAVVAGALALGLVLAIHYAHRGRQ